MSHPRTSREPSPAVPTLVMLGLLFALSLGSATSIFAQSGPGDYGPGGPGGGWRGGGRMGPPHGGGRSMVWREAIEGPPSPAIMRDSIELSADQLDRYARRYADHMTATRPARDSLRTSMQTVRAAFQNGDRSGARQQRDVIQRQSKELTDRDKQFDKGLKDILTKDQQKRYQKWKDNREKQQRDEWQSARRSSESREGWVNQSQVR